jgi:hypothetical protein
LLERFALRTLFRQMKVAGSCDWVAPAAPVLVGAEWWIQRRAHEREADDIPWHFDEDQELYHQEGLTVSPDLSTVTYLTSYGNPTLVLSQPTLRPFSDGSALQGLGAHCDAGLFVSHPVAGKHLAFDGRLLHGCPTTHRIDHIAGEWLSLLVNLWLGYQPTGVERFPGVGRLAREDQRRPAHGLLSLHDMSDVKLLNEENKAGFETFELEVECGPWRFEGVKLPLHLAPAHGISCFRLGRGNLQAHYSEE